MGMKDGNILLYHDISENIRDFFFMREYTDIEVYASFNNPFPFDCGIPDLNLTPMSIPDSLFPKIISHYIYDPLSDAIYVASKTYVGNLNAPCESPQVILIFTPLQK